MAKAVSQLRGEVLQDTQPCKGQPKEQGTPRIVWRSIHTKSLHGIVQGLCILVGIKALEILH